MKNILNTRQNPKLLNRLLNRIGYTDTLIAKYGILLVAARRRLDKENPYSLISVMEKKLSFQIKTLIELLHLPNNVYWPLMAIFSYPSRRIGECHPWITQFQTSIGSETVDKARRVRVLMDVYRSTTLRWFEHQIGTEKLEDFRNIIDKIQHIHYLSDRDEYEENEDLTLTNIVVDNFCPHWNDHKSLSEIRSCPNVTKYLEPKFIERVRLGLYILTDDYVGWGRKLRRIIRDY
jgi:hypothetical protein